MNENTIDLERALLHTVDAELKLMHSFSEKHLPVDLSTTVAMRMSRAVVSSICRLGDQHSDLITEVTHQYLQRASERLIDLSADYERRIRESIDKTALLLIWKA